MIKTDIKYKIGVIEVCNDDIKKPYLRIHVGELGVFSRPFDLSKEAYDAPKLLRDLANDIEHRIRVLGHG